MSLIYVEAGNFLPREADASDPQAKAYREKMRQWATAYERMCLSYNRTGSCVVRGVRPKYWFQFDFCRPGYMPKPNQADAIILGINAGRAAIFANMGFGKTYVGGYIGRYLQRHRGLDKKVLVLCPKVAIGEWEKELPKFFDISYSVFPQNPYLDGDFVICNYEQADKLIEARDQFGAIILDESQRMKNMDTCTFATIEAICDMNVFHRYVLSGTPVLNQPNDMFTQLSLINPFAMGFSYQFMMSTFFKRSLHEGRSRDSFVRQYTKLFQDKATKNAIIFQQATTDATSSEEFIGVDATEEQRKAIEDIHQGFTILEGRAPVVGQPPETLVELKNVATKEAQVSSGFLKAGDRTIYMHSRKLGAVYDDAMQYPGQVIIWTYFQETTQRLRKAIPDSACIYGATTAAQRTRIVSDFQAGKVRVLIAQLKAANTALNLQFCHYEIFAEYDWAHATIAQAKARILRQGQTQECKFKYYYTKGTIDTVMLSVIKQKKQVTAEIISNYMKSGMKQAHAV